MKIICYRTDSQPNVHKGEMDDAKGESPETNDNQYSFGQRYNYWPHWNKHDASKMIYVHKRGGDIKQHLQITNGRF